MRSYQTGPKPHMFLWICSTILDGRWLDDSLTTTLLSNSIVAMHFLEKSDFFLFLPFFQFFPIFSHFFLFFSFSSFIYLFLYFAILYFLLIFVYFSFNFTVLSFQIQQFPNRMSIWTEFIREIFVKPQKPNKNMWFCNKNYTIYVLCRRVLLANKLKIIKYLKVNENLYRMK